MFGHMGQLGISILELDWLLGFPFEQIVQLGISTLELFWLLGFLF